MGPPSEVVSSIPKAPEGTTAYRGLSFKDLREMLGEGNINSDAARQGLEPAKISESIDNDDYDGVIDEILDHKTGRGGGGGFVSASKDLETAKIFSGGSSSSGGVVIELDAEGAIDTDRIEGSTKWDPVKAEAEKEVLFKGEIPKDRIKKIHIYKDGKLLQTFDSIDDFKAAGGTLIDDIKNKKAVAFGELIDKFEKRAEKPASNVGITDDLPVPDKTPENQLKNSLKKAAETDIPGTGTRRSTGIITKEGIGAAGKAVGKVLAAVDVAISGYDAIVKAYNLDDFTKPGVRIQVGIEEFGRNIAAIDEMVLLISYYVFGEPVDISGKPGIAESVDKLTNLDRIRLENLRNDIQEAESLRNELQKYKNGEQAHLLEVKKNPLTGEKTINRFGFKKDTLPAEHDVPLYLRQNDKNWQETYNDERIAQKAAGRLEELNRRIQRNIDELTNSATVTPTKKQASVEVLPGGIPNP